MAFRLGRRRRSPYDAGIDWWGLITIVGIIVLFVLSLVRGAFVSRDDAVRAAETFGFSEVQITNHHWFLVGFAGCDMQDAAAFPARAINPTGDPVEIVVCSGFPLKGFTVRIK